MEALQEAIRSLADYQHRINQDTFRGDLNARTRYENAAYQEGMLSAAIAQAEALELIAKRLEEWMSVQGVLPEFFEYVDRAKIREAQEAMGDPDEGGSLADYKYRRAQAQAWAKAERGE